jgi:hypothetical protein
MSRWVYSLELTVDLYVSRFGSVGFPVDIGALQFRAVGSTYGRPVAVAVGSVDQGNVGSALPSIKGVGIG